MNSITFKCKVITPMFMSGADGRTPELRPSEFKAMMRFWWRAAKVTDNIDELQKEEAKIFGGTGEGEGKSKVSIRVAPVDKIEKFIGENIISAIHSYDGNKYFLYSTFALKAKGEQIIRKYIKPDFSFVLFFTIFDEKKIKEILASFWLATYLGGFGTRARRGGGNITIEKVEGLDNNLTDIDFIIEGSNSKVIANWVTHNFNKAISIIGKPEKFCSSYSNLSFSRFVISSKGKNSWIEALNDIGKIFKEFREEHRKDIFNSAVFGLPVIHRNNNIKIEGKNIKRRSSPLIFKILCVEKQFYWLVLRLSGEFLPEGEVLEKKPKSPNKNSQKPDYCLIEKFWKQLKKSQENEYLLSMPQTLYNSIEKIKSLNPNKIILYGSRARGDAHKKADIDIAVDTDQNTENISLPGIYDIVNFNKVNSSLKEKISKEGCIIYERKN